MVVKRPFSDEGSYELPWKHPRQFEYTYQLPSFVESVPGNDAVQKSHTSAYTRDGALNKCQYRDRYGSEHAMVDQECGTSDPGSIPSFSWVYNSTSKEDSRSKAPFHLSYFPGLFESDYPTRPHLEKEQTCSSTLDYLPRKLVPIGPDHQADIPVWEEHGKNNDPQSVDASVPSVAPHKSVNLSENADDVDPERMMGTCVIPMPNLEASGDEVGRGRSDCSCQDEGSVRCVKQHIMEAREKLMEKFGQEAFAELGLWNMGESVASKWTEEEEEDFSKVIVRFPASLGKNFWDRLSLVLPSRSKKEIVSYYFNVFMLRRRGEQNRLDPLNVDSDDDEWHFSEYGDEDDDSIVEAAQGEEDQPLHGEVESTRDDDDAASCDNDDAIFEYNRKLHYDSEEDSCTSYECQLSSRPEKQSDHSRHFENNYCYDMETCDTKVWDVGFLSICKTDVDLLSTCNMIEEVFGDENKGSNDDGTA